QMQTPELHDQRQLVLLPIGADRARRFLRTLVRRAPQEVRNLVVISGDSLSFNTIYRDRDITWNMLDVPVPLVLFSHPNPVDPAAGFRAQATGDDSACCTGTEVLLLYRDILETLVQAAYQDGRLLADADALIPRFRQARWA